MSSHWTCITRSLKLGKWVFVNSIGNFSPDSDNDRIIEAENFDQLKVNLRKMI